MDTSRRGPKTNLLVGRIRAISWLPGITSVSAAERDRRLNLGVRATRDAAAFSFLRELNLPITWRHSLVPYLLSTLYASHVLKAASPLRYKQRAKRSGSSRSCARPRISRLYLCRTASRRLFGCPCAPAGPRARIATTKV